MTTVSETNTAVVSAVPLLPTRVSIEPAKLLKDLADPFAKMGITSSMAKVVPEPVIERPSRLVDRVAPKFLQRLQPVAEVAAEAVVEVAEVATEAAAGYTPSEKMVKILALAKSHRHGTVKQTIRLLRRWEENVQASGETKYDARMELLLRTCCDVLESEPLTLRIPNTPLEAMSPGDRGFLLEKAAKLREDGHLAGYPPMLVQWTPEQLEVMRKYAHDIGWWRGMKNYINHIRDNFDRDNALPMFLKEVEDMEKNPAAKRLTSSLQAIADDGTTALLV